MEWSGVERGGVAWSGMGWGDVGWDDSSSKGVLNVGHSGFYGGGDENDYSPEGCPYHLPAARPLPS